MHISFLGQNPTNLRPGEGGSGGQLSTHLDPVLVSHPHPIQVAAHGSVSVLGQAPPLGQAAAPGLATAFGHAPTLEQAVAPTLGQAAAPTLRQAAAPGLAPTFGHAPTLGLATALGQAAAPTLGQAAAPGLATTLGHAAAPELATALGQTAAPGLATTLGQAATSKLATAPGLAPIFGQAPALASAPDIVTALGLPSNGGAAAVNNLGASTHGIGTVGPDALGATTALRTLFMQNVQNLFDTHDQSAQETLLARISDLETEIQASQTTCLNESHRLQGGLLFENINVMQSITNSVLSSANVIRNIILFYKNVKYKDCVSCRYAHYPRHFHFPYFLISMKV